MSEQSKITINIMHVINHWWFFFFQLSIWNQFQGCCRLDFSSAEQAEIYFLSNTRSVFMSTCIETRYFAGGNLNKPPESEQL